MVGSSSKSYQIYEILEWGKTIYYSRPSSMVNGPAVDRGISSDGVDSQDIIGTTIIIYKDEIILDNEVRSRPV